MCLLLACYFIALGYAMSKAHILIHLHRDEPSSYNFVTTPFYELIEILVSSCQVVPIVGSWIFIGLFVVVTPLWTTCELFSLVDRIGPYL
jgi:hypothetical protein